MRIGLIGGVRSSQLILKKLKDHGANVVLVMGYEPKDSSLVSGYQNLKETAADSKYAPFVRINDHVSEIKQADLDVLFVVGISQLVCDEIVNAPKLGCIGFHPTNLPRGRGRAPLAWLVMEREAGAANFFLLTETADAGPLFVQERFQVEPNDDSASVEIKMLHAIDVALDRWLPKLLKGEWDPVTQPEKDATEYGVRRPEDGLIDWQLSAEQIDRLVKASAPPHPGAFTFCDNKRLVVLSSSLEEKIPIKGVVGRVLKFDGSRALVQCANGLLWIESFEFEGKLRVGKRLGYQAELEIFQLKQEIEKLKSLIHGRQGE